MSDLSYRPLGRSGLLVSAVGIGCNNFGREGTVTESLDGTRAVVDAAIDAGVTLFDTADIYGREYGLSERLLGQAIAGRRDEIVLATKFGHVDYESPIPNWGAKGSRRYIRLAVEGSLRRLGTDWIDLYQLHTPDPFTPIEETIAALDELVHEGKIRYAGHSNFAGWQLTEADWAARTAGHPAFISAQNEYSLLVRGAERELFPAMRAAGVGFLPYFPLYNGLFTGKFSRDGGPADSRIMRQRKHLLDTAPWDAIEAYQAFCDERGISMLEATFGWLLVQDGLSSVIAGATTPEQIRANAAAGSAWSPTAEEAAWISDRFPVG
ncbi:Predicted oxidoreductase [Plantibacter flavus]|uniref:Aryl-alcohol dehydrogenase-like predicted oxidoreductase n=1 Tax=Plantibacter flavus TaxID=150123 RepID=A0A3N2C467_9MICO|nr:aldo/keto reductase [Plantibacter flavus]ROR82297.1 aryl-alcohol dehydrogenase-like predicted oxidoreductase [Plantibacter flavus]SMG43021.1 Predicted oxidoreductase [Plantibacter flavus]